MTVPDLRGRSEADALAALFALLPFVHFFVMLTTVGLGAVLILAGVRLAAAFRAHRRAASVTSGSVGTLFLGFGAKLATASLN